MRVFLKKGIECLTSIGNSCPYTLLGKKAVQHVKGKRETNHVKSEQERDLLSRLKLGRNIALIGLFCPIFWYSLLSGAPLNEVYFNAVHSGVVIILGLMVRLNARRKLNKGKI